MHADGTPTFPEYRDGAPSYANAYLWPKLKEIIAARTWADRRAFDLGCGNGATCAMLAELGFTVTGVDTSQSGIAEARKHAPKVTAHIGNVYDDLAAQYGTFPLVVSLEVIEHCYDPRAFARTFLSLLAPGGIGVLSTPYHGYLKNVAIALTNRSDAHFSPLWVGGHIKFFSERSLGQLLAESGAGPVKFLRAGRLPFLAKSMIAVVNGR